MLEIESKALGAELTSIKINGQEKLHQGNRVLDQNGNVFWGRHAPVLFPIVGRLKDDYTIINGQECKMTQHGFARDMEFETLKKENNIHEYLLRFNQETLDKFPYRFELYIKYVVMEDVLKVFYIVKNVDNKEIEFGIGGHPAFYINPLCNNNLIFEKEEHKIQFLQLENGLICDDNSFVKSRFTNNQVIHINEETFTHDAIIMENIESNMISLTSDGNKILDFDFSSFPKLAVWSKMGAPFVCIEPWFTTADTIDSSHRFCDKNSICLEKNKEFQCSYQIKFYG
ncbi:MAG: aldose 1-epimerase family protein [Clostridia bacterium]|nr:aldose 1-epimerase family protein [Clostridia bacterium]